MRRLEYFEVNPKGHVWSVSEHDPTAPAYEEFNDEDGFNFHGGPWCTVCHYSFCQHCHSEVPVPCKKVDE